LIAWNVGDIAGERHIALVVASRPAAAALSAGDFVPRHSHQVSGQLFGFVKASHFRWVSEEGDPNHLHKVLRVESGSDAVIEAAADHSVQVGNSLRPSSKLLSIIAAFLDRLTGG
jgi:hypothetical protein